MDTKNILVTKAAEPHSSSEKTRAQIFAAAEKLFAHHGFHAVSIRHITAEAGTNIASVSYHFGSKDDLLFEIFRTRAAELNRERARLLHEAENRYDGRPPLREILAALFAPPVRWLYATDERHTSLQFIFRVRSEGTLPMRDLLHRDVSHLVRFAEALKKALPGLAEDAVYWYLHFCLGLIHNNRPAEFERLDHLSRGITREIGAEALLNLMLNFAEAGFRAEFAIDAISR